MDNNPSQKTKKNNKKRKREEAPEEIEKIIFSQQQNQSKNSPIITGNQNNLSKISEKIENEKKQIEKDKNFWETIIKENMNEILLNDKGFSYGNYDRYYYKRYLEALKDPRLEIFQTEWFKDKEVLDIGCNDGTVTILTAVNYQPKKIEGIDVDYKLVMKAIKNMKYTARNNLNKTIVDTATGMVELNHALEENNNNSYAENVNLIDEILQNDEKKEKINHKILKKSTNNNNISINKGLNLNSNLNSNQNHNNENKSTNNAVNISETNLEIRKRLEAALSGKSHLKEIINKLDALPKSFLINLGIPQKEIHKRENLSEIKNECNQNFPHNISFKQENYVHKFKDIINEANKFDTIMCLSVVKWIHLNYGDTGVKTLFYNVYSQLKNGGIFLFEPQSWKSYKKRRNLNLRIKDNYKKISLRPEQFQSYLEETYGFKLLNKVQPPSNSKNSFDRPIFIFRKE